MIKHVRIHRFSVEIFGLKHFLFHLLLKDGIKKTDKSFDINEYHSTKIYLNADETEQK